MSVLVIVGLFFAGCVVVFIGTYYLAERRERRGK